MKGFNKPFKNDKDRVRFLAMFLLLMTILFSISLAINISWLIPSEQTCSTPQDIIQQCDDLRMSLDNLSEQIFTNNNK